MTTKHILSEEDIKDAVRKWVDDQGLGPSGDVRFLGDDDDEITDTIRAEVTKS